MQQSNNAFCAHSNEFLPFSIIAVGIIVMFAFQTGACAHTRPQKIMCTLKPFAVYGDSVFIDKTHSPETSRRIWRMIYLLRARALFMAAFSIRECLMRSDVVVIVVSFYSDDREKWRNSTHSRNERRLNMFSICSCSLNKSTWFLLLFTTRPRESHGIPSH